MKNKKKSYLWKLLATIIMMVCFIMLVKQDVENRRGVQPEGNGIPFSDVKILLQAASQKTELPKVEEWIASTEKGYTDQQELLRYEDYQKLQEAFQNPKLQKKWEPENQKYQNTFSILLKDWNELFSDVLTTYGLTDLIVQKEINVLSYGENVRTLEREPLQERELLSDTGDIVPFASENWKKNCFSKVLGYYDTVDGKLLVPIEKISGSLELQNLWILEEEQELLFLFDNYLVTYSEKEGERYEIRESVADLYFEKGELIRTEKQKEKVSGKLLECTEEALVIDGIGKLSISDQCRIYQLTDTLQEVESTALPIGYDFADYVIKEGKICAILILRKENMETIRVAIMDDDFLEYYHESLEMVADCDMEMRSGSYQNREVTQIPAGKTICFDRSSKELWEERIELIPKVHSGKIQILNLKRAVEYPAYHGKLEIVLKPDGLLLINEVYLEEYLYSVVPSEMPPSYEVEALKAQAICARTYAYRYLALPGLAALGANVDDSTGYQVYNNRKEQWNSTQAVLETSGKILYHEGEIAPTYYYSTSCGFGTDDRIWSGAESSSLCAQHIAEEEELQERRVQAENMQEEAAFEAYLSSTGEKDYERELPWYRWSYEVPEIDIEQLKAQTGWELEEILEIKVKQRLEGGIVDQLLFETDQGEFELEGELQIRKVLSQGGEIERQDGTTIAAGKILPSAYFTITTIKKAGNVVGYSLLGGGYGHGVGMSQNGANQMALTGMQSEEILAFFYPTCELMKLY